MAKSEVGQVRCRKADCVLFALIVILILTINLLSLDNNCYWGDDFAAYISEGISIADGYFDKQVKLNVLMHPSPLPAAGAGIRRCRL